MTDALVSVGLPLVVGVLAGVVNTIAGGGSFLTIPLLVETGLTAPVANATNRIAVWMQSATSASVFHRRGHLPARAALRLIPIGIAGAVVGALLAGGMSDAPFRKVLAALFGIMGVILVVQVARGHGSERADTTELPRGWRAQVAMLAIGFYSGFVQAGVGVFMLLILHVASRVEIVTANAVKVFFVLAFTTISLGIFAAQGIVAWGPGLALGVGGILGGWLGVVFATRINARALRTALAIGVFAASLRFAGVF